MSLTKVPAIPVLTASNIQDVASAVKNLLDIREGLIGDPLDSYITYRDLLDAGLAQKAVGLTPRSVVGTVIMPTWADVDGYDPTQDFTPPPPPANFSVASAMTSIILQWDTPTYRNHSYTQIWRSTTNVIGNATLLGTSSTTFYTDPVGKTSTMYYYWVRFVSQANVFGPYHATNGLSGATGLVGGADLSNLIITSDKLAAASVIEGKIADGAIALAKIADGAISNAKLAALAVTASKLADGSVTSSKITDAAIVGSKLADLAIESAKLADSAVTATKIANLAVGSAAIANAAITSAKIADLAVGTAAIADAAIGSAKIAALAVGSAAIANLAVTNAKIGDLAVDTAKIANAAIVSAKIGDLAVTNAKIDNAAITNAKIGDLAVDTAKIADLAVNNAKIGNLAVTNAKIGGAIQSNDFASGSAGWRIDKDGSAELNNATFRGTLACVGSSGSASLQIRNTFLKVFDSNGALRVQIGDLSA